MDRLILPTLFAALLWWISTGVVLHAVNRSRSGYAGTFAVATALLVIGLAGLYASSRETGTAAAFVAFGSALLIWGWHEMSFLMGLITGPQRRPAVLKAGQRANFADAAGTVIYHEAAIALTVVLVVALTWGEPNQAGTWAFIVLWLMRLSTKLNIYLGVPNITEGFLPQHLTYLKTYFCRRPMNMLFPLSVTATTAAVCFTSWKAVDPATSPQDAAGFALAAALLALALIEHWFLVLPFDAAKLWAWADRGTSEDPVTIVPACPQAAVTGGLS